jgi:hypothetical protein
MTSLKKITVSQEALEWNAILAIANTIVQSTSELEKVFSSEDQIVFGAAIATMEQQLPKVMIHGFTYSVTFGSRHVDVLTMLVDWFDEFYLLMGKWTEARNPEAYAIKYQQIGLVKRNLKLYAKESHAAEET